MRYLFAAVFFLLAYPQAWAEPAKSPSASELQISAEVKQTVRNLLNSSGALDATEFGLVPEVRVIESYRITDVTESGAVTSVKVELSVSGIKKYDELNHRYNERRFSKAVNEKIVIELKQAGGKTVLIRPIASYSLRRALK